MTKYIKCKDALALLQPDDPNDERCAVTVATAKRLIRHLLTVTPAADVATVVHGRWIHDGCRVEGGIDWCHCSECGKSDNFCARTNYCPKCGAKMDGGDGDAVNQR